MVLGVLERDLRGGDAFLGSRALRMLRVLALVVGLAWPILVFAAVWIAPTQTFALMSATLSPDNWLAHPYAAAMRLAFSPLIVICLAMVVENLVRAGCFDRWQTLYPILAVIQVVLYFQAPSLFVEDGPAEAGSAFLALVAAGLLAVSGRGRFDARTLLALGFAFYALEEISWGERIFGFHPEAIMPVANEQGEINLHNYINGVLNLSAAVLFLACLWAVSVRGQIPLIRHMPGFAEIVDELLRKRLWIVLAGITFLALVAPGELFEEQFAVLGLLLAAALFVRGQRIGAP